MENVLAMLRGRGDIKSFGVVTTCELEVSASMGATKSFHPLKGGPQKFYPVLSGVGGLQKYAPLAISSHR